VGVSVGFPSFGAVEAAERTEAGADDDDEKFAEVERWLGGDPGGGAYDPGTCSESESTSPPPDA